MAYKFQLDSAIMSGSLTQEGTLLVKNDAGATHATITTAGAISGSGQIDGGSLMIGRADNLFAVTALGALTTPALASLDGGIDVNGDFVVNTDGQVTAVGVIAGGAVSAATAVSGTGLFSAGAGLAAGFGTQFTVSNAGVMVAGASTLGATSVVSLDANSGGITEAGAIAGATDVDGSGDLTMGTITMPGFEVDADGDTSVKSLSGSGVIEGLSLKLDSVAVTSTAAELNLMDGGTARGTNAIANGDGIVTNDDGTMRQTTVQTFQTYFDANSVGGANIVTVGALNAGSITSGFSSIDVGAGAISTTGLGTFGQVTATGLSGTLRYSLDVEADGGVGMTPFQNTANVADMKLSASFLPAAAIAVATDQLMFYDADGSVKRESFVDLATAMAGGGITATNGVLSTEGGAADSIADGGTLAEGYNFLTGTDGGTFTLPQAVVSVDAGSKIIIKNSSAGLATINTFAANTIDGASSIILESPYAAVTLVYSSTSGSWALV
jgi:hypothetical protein